MLTSLVIAFLLLHGGTALGFTTQLDQLASHVKKDITVEATRKQALAIVDQAESANKAFTEERKKDAEGLGKVLADRQATAAQIEAAVKPFLATDSVTTDRMVDAYLALRPVVGAADWGKVTAPPPPKVAK